ncbi:uncharacterized protein B0H64DRAFT_18881 [Chaetomium fimeti]|uniref:Uncharacterized protein n=1 Tax=Chaetomium fimeti TaxID=1854472 RepID=A0AAE0HQ19_9PEZI|nr:hypothetical protein B0H64DRAFT_18881 [Chaetomium fimeti]
MSQSTAATAAAPNSDPKPDNNNRLYDPALPRDGTLLQQTLRPAPDAIALCTPHIPPSITTEPIIDVGLSLPNPNDVLLIIPTANASKTALFTSHLAATRPSHITSLTHLQIPAESGVGEQPYDSAGPRGAFNRVLGAVSALQVDPAHREALLKVRPGTVIVGAVENFVRRERGADGVVVPVDYGVVVMCRMSLASREPGPWEWRVGVSQGVTVPVEYWRAAEAFGFEDEAGTHGKVTVGEVIEANVEGVDSGNWFESLTAARVSRYDLLRGAMEGMEVPWPVATGADAPAVVV